MAHPTLLNGLFYSKLPKTFLNLPKEFEKNLPKIWNLLYLELILAMSKWFDRWVDEMFQVPWWGNAFAALSFGLLSWKGIPNLERFWAGQEMWLGLGSLFCWAFTTVLITTSICTAIVARRRGELFKGETSINTLKPLSWIQFEDFVAELFRRREYIVEKRGGSSPDGGIDIIVSKNGAITLVQCKHYRFQKVGVKVVREMLGVVVVENANRGFVVALEGFTPDAEKFAKRTKGRIKLITGCDLLTVLKKIKKDERAKSLPQPAFPIVEHPTALVSQPPDR